MIVYWYDIQIITMFATSITSYIFMWTKNNKLPGWNFLEVVPPIAFQRGAYLWCSLCPGRTAGWADASGTSWACVGSSCCPGRPRWPSAWRLRKGRRRTLIPWPRGNWVGGCKSIKVKVKYIFFQLSLHCPYNASWTTRTSCTLIDILFSWL